MNAAPPVERRRWVEWLGPLCTALVVALAHALEPTALRVPNPPALLVLCIVFSAFQGGVSAGLVSAAIAWIYVASFFSTPDRFLVFSDENLRRVAVWAFTMPATAVLVGLLQERSVRLRSAQVRHDAMEAEVHERLQSETSLAARAHQQAVVAELGRAALAGTDLRQLFDLAVEQVAATFGVEFAEVLELGPDGGVLTLAAGVGWKEGLVGRATINAGPGTQAEYLLRSTQPLVVEDLGAETRFQGSELLRDHGVISGLSVVIGDLDRPFGVLSAHSSLPHTFTADDTYFVQAVANVLAVALRARKADEELRRAARHLANVTAVSPAVLYTLHVEGDSPVTTWISDNVTALAGCTAAEALQPNWWMSCVHVDDRAAARAQEVEACRQGGADLLSHEYRFVRRDGNVVWVRDEMRVLRDAQGVAREIVGAMMDVTDRRQLEERFLQAQKMDTVGRLAGGVAHDFNNLITVITNVVDLASREVPGTSPLLNDLLEIRRAAERAGALTSQLLAFSRRQIQQLEVLNLNAALDELSTMLPRVLGDDVDLVIRRGERLGNVRADPGQVAQVVMNLAVNSRDAMPTGGTLTIETANVTLDDAFARRHPGAARGDYVMLAVSDTGVGMDAAIQQKIFEPFFTTKAVGHGTGLGLATVYGIVKQSGGIITTTSEVGRGATFRVYLPRVDEAVRETRPARSGEPLRGTETILIVEDQPAVRQLTKRLLEKVGYTVLTAADATGAALATQRHGGAIDLLLTDVVMPRVSGPEVAARLRADFPDLKVMFMSGYTEDTIVHQGVLDEGTPFISKPFDLLTLTRKVREVLDA